MLGRERIAAETAAEIVISGLLDPMSCWEDACALPDHDAPPVVACLEVAFARVAVARHMFRKTQRAAVAEALCEAADAIVRRSFPDRGDAATDAFYAMPLFEAAPRAVAGYEEPAALPHALAEALLARLGVHPAHAWQAAPLFGRSGNEAGETLRRMRVAAPAEPGRLRLPLPRLAPLFGG
ncbi:MAG: hypothetical protein ACK4K7_06490 [Allosphingosinicella sp.]|uniref:hypothetical protein n=1 Tax=Allosphingosinicella sp. TaxID=2823234 RepID=UPI00395E4DAB